MTNRGNTQPQAFEVVNRDGTAHIIFRENIHEISAPEPDSTMYEWEEYRLERAWRNMLQTDILNNKAAWLSAAKAMDEKRNPPDISQMRADIDYLQIMQSAMYGISLMAADTSSDPTVLDLSWKYYPSRWDKTRLMALVQMQKLTADDYEDITGEAYTA